MYAWLQNYSELEYELERPLQRFDLVSEFPQISWDKVETPPVEQMSLIGQFFTANSAWWGDSIQLATTCRSQEARTMMMKEIAPHFSKVMEGIETGGSGGEGIRWDLSLKQLKPESLELFEKTSTAALPLLEDLYRHRNFAESYMEKGRSQPPIRFRIDPAKLEPCPASFLTELAALKEFLVMTYFNQQDPPEYAVMPLGWILENDLKDSLALRFFASFVPTMDLYVDAKTHQVDFVLMSFSPMKSTLKRSQTELVKPRVHKDYFYYDIGQELVMVVDLHAAERGTQAETLAAWEKVEGQAVYLRNEGVAFEQFDHEENGEIPEGVFFLPDQVTMNRMLVAVLHELAKRS